MIHHPIQPCRFLTPALIAFVWLGAYVDTSSALADEPKVTLEIGRWLAGEGANEEAKPSPLKTPFGVDFDSDGVMTIVELDGGRVHQKPPEGPAKVIAGDGSRSYQGDGGPAAAATFDGMHNVAVTADGDMLIADSWNHCVRKIDGKSGQVSTLIGTGKAGFSGDNGPADQARFNFLMCVSLNPSGDALYIADLKNRRIRKVDLKTNIVTTVAGNGEKGKPTDGALAVDSPLVDPRAVAVDSRGNVYILERSGHALRRVSPQGRVETVAGNGVGGFRDGPALEAQLKGPKHLCIDAQDRVVIADEENRAIRLFDPDAKTLTTILGRRQGEPAVTLSRPHGVCYENGRLTIVDTGHDRVLSIPWP